MRTILVFNAGSATIKFKLFLTKDLKEVIKGEVERIGLKDSFITLTYKNKSESKFYKKGLNFDQSLKLIIKKLKEKNLLKDISKIGHRIVHGGEEFRETTLLNPAKIRKIEKYNILAPLHNPYNLRVVKFCFKEFKQIPQFGVFDTAYFKNIPLKAALYGLPYSFYKKWGIKKLGFHGISHSYVSKKAARILKKPLNKLKIISLHLGSGASISAIYKGKAIDTSMGFTPLNGILMGTRPGDLDPGIILYLLQTKKLNLNNLSQIINKMSGFKGLSGISSDLREILAKRKINHKAKLVIDKFVYDIIRYIGSYATIMKGIDVLIFTGGIGERSKFIRDSIIRRLNILKPFKVLVIPTDEEKAIAQEIRKL